VAINLWVSIDVCVQGRRVREVTVKKNSSVCHWRANQEEEAGSEHVTWSSHVPSAA